MELSDVPPAAHSCSNKSHLVKAVSFVDTASVDTGSTTETTSPTTAKTDSINDAYSMGMPITTNAIQTIGISNFEYPIAYKRVVSRRDWLFRLACLIITISATSVLVCTVSVFDWKTSIAIQLSSLILFLQSYLVFHHNFALIGNIKLSSLDRASFSLWNTLPFKLFNSRTSNPFTRYHKCWQTPKAMTLVSVLQ
jgi:hypothetical protein